MEGRLDGVGRDDKMILLRKSLGRLVEAFFPHFCVDCGQEGKVFCSSCRALSQISLRGVFTCPACGEKTPLGERCARRSCQRSPIDGSIAAAPYAAAPLRRLLHLYKYQAVDEAEREVERAFGAFVAGHLPLLEFLDGATVIPVPMSSIRRAVRGFNQSEALSGVIGGLLGLPVDNGVLGRHFRWYRQAEIKSAEARARNAAGSVFLKSPLGERRRFVLIDDVMTTGATLAECATVLRDAGAEEVWVVTLLRG